MGKWDGDTLVVETTGLRDGGWLDIIGTPLSDMERTTILATLDQCSGDKRRTAELLGVSLKTLYNRLSEYGRTPATS